MWLLQIIFILFIGWLFYIAGYRKGVRAMEQVITPAAKQADNDIAYLRARIRELEHPKTEENPYAEMAEYHQRQKEQAQE